MPGNARVLRASAPWLDHKTALAAFAETRTTSTQLAAPLSPEDMLAQSMPDVSPTKWHLAHTSWFFDTFLLRDFDPDYRPFDDRFHYLFNSYYEAEGPRQPRPHRGLITRPSVAEILAYRAHVDAAVTRLADRCGEGDWPRIAAIMELGCQHEQQHQELMLTDIKHVLFQNPFAPAYAKPYPKEVRAAAPLGFHNYAGGRLCIGHGGDSFAFDNEGPRHERLLEPYRLGTRLITNAEYYEFVADGGYETPALWLSDGWAKVQEEGWRSPLYWHHDEADGWQMFTLRGRQPINWHEPVSNLSFFEADAFASWAGARLPLEAELEHAVQVQDSPGPVNDLSSGKLHPTRAPDPTDACPVTQLAGDVWEWTRSAYEPYPRFKPLGGAIGEYNGKFMCNQFVLRGGSFATPAGHWRPTYRNFFPPDARWQFSGLRLAKDL